MSRFRISGTTTRASGDGSFRCGGLFVYRFAVTSLRVGVVLLASTALASSVAACAPTATTVAPNEPCVMTEAPAQPPTTTYPVEETEYAASHSTPSDSGDSAGDSALEPSGEGAPSGEQTAEVNDEPILDVDQGPAVGGPKNNRPCAFHESVDSYERRCVATKNADGSLHVEAKGTALNPDNGFEFTLRGGPHQFVARGTLDSFGICKGPFVAYVNTVIDKGVTTYELRFKNHCKIVIR